MLSDQDYSRLLLRFILLYFYNQNRFLNSLMSSFNPYHHFGFLTNRVARLISRSVDDFLEEKGHHYPTSCVGILADLWAKDGVNQKDLGMSLVKNKSSINKMLHSLEKAGLIEKRLDPTDGRGKLIFLTAKGKKMRLEAEKRSSQLDKDLLRHFSAEELNTTKQVLAVLYQQLAAPTEFSEPSSNTNRS